MKKINIDGFMQIYDFWKTIWVWKTILRDLNYVKCSNIALMKKAWFMAPIEYALMVYSPNGKGMVLRKIVFRSGNRHGKR